MEEAFVLWLDMLGYKSWLSRQHDLAIAEGKLLDALNVAFSAAKIREQAFADFCLNSVLISDTIIIWSFKVDVDTLLCFSVFYHVLNCELSRMGLPLRGVLSKGSIRIRNIEPRIILGDAVIKCASLEHKLNAFVLAIDGSVWKYLLEEPIATDKVGYWKTMLSIKHINTKEGLLQLSVVNWYLPVVALGIIKAYRLLVDKYDNNENGIVSELKMFIPMMLNSRYMIDTLKSDEYTASISKQWQENIQHAVILANDIGIVMQ